MPEERISLQSPTCELRKSGATVGITDRVYPVIGSAVVFDEVLVRGDLSGDLEYNEHVLRITAVDTMIGLELGPQGPRGPLWKGVACMVVAS